jgi:hypothetical protein
MWAFRGKGEILC